MLLTMCELRISFVLQIHSVSPSISKAHSSCQLLNCVCVVCVFAALTLSIFSHTLWSTVYKKKSELHTLQITAALPWYKRRTVQFEVAWSSWYLKYAYITARKSNCFNPITAKLITQLLIPFDSNLPFLATIPTL